MSKAQSYQKILDELPSRQRNNWRFDYAKFEKENPDTKMFSWTTIAMNAWHFLTSTYETGKSFMPPLHVHMNKTKSSKNDNMTLGGLEVHYAWFNGAAPNEYSLVMPVQYECNIYQKNFLRCMRQRFKNIQNVPEISMIIFMTHLLLHEFIHYVDARDIFESMYTNKDIPWSDRCKLMKEHVDHLNTFEDEKETESAAIEASTLFAYDFWCDTLSNAAYYAHPVIGGPFDLHLRKSSEIWRVIASTLEIIEIERFMIFEECSDEDDVNRHLRKKELVKWLTEYAKAHNTQKWAIVP